MPGTVNTSRESGRVPRNSSPGRHRWGWERPLSLSQRYSLHLVHTGSPQEQLQSKQSFAAPWLSTQLQVTGAIGGCLQSSPGRAPSKEHGALHALSELWKNPPGFHLVTCAGHTTYRWLVGWLSDFVLLEVNPSAHQVNIPVHTQTQPLTPAVH